MTYDVFISHASEDKDDIARPLANALVARGYSVWFDEMTLKLGDSLRGSIDAGLISSRFGIVVLSPSFFAKNWPEYELNSLTTIEIERGQKCILPIWHNVNKNMVMRYSASLADKVADVSTLGLDKLCARIGEVVGVPSNQPTEVVEIPQDIRDRICPSCGQLGEHFGFDGGDGDEAYWFECGHCGYFRGA